MIESGDSAPYPPTDPNASRRRALPLRLFLLLIPTLVVSLVAAGCGGEDDEDDDRPRQSLSAPESRSGGAESPENTRLVTLTEPTEQAYTVKAPEGWDNHTALVQVYDQKRPLVTATRPGDGTFLFLGDPQMPAFAVPTPQFDGSDPLSRANPMLKFAPYTPAKEFFTRYLQQKFGKLPDFRIVGAAPHPRLEGIMREAMQKKGMTGDLSTVLIAFDYRDNGKPIHSLVNGTTLSIGTVWIADVNGVSTGGDPTRYNDLLLQMAQSFETNPQWQAQQMALSRQRHEANMALIRAGTETMNRRHEANMAAIQASAARHQQRMAALQAAGDARLDAWKAQQAQNDASHERFMNYIKGEETVVGPSGGTSQVEAGQGRYFRNKTDNTYVGTDSTKELEDLRKIWGLNPDDYESVTVKR